LNKKIGNISFYDSQGRDTFTKPYSEETAKIIDQEVSNLIETQYQRALALLTENKDHLISLAEKLLTEEVIFKEDLESIFGKRPWDPLIDLHNDSVRPVVETVENEAQENSVEETPEATEPEESTKSEEETGPDSNKG
jgi:cell division protease FtsH